MRIASEYTELNTLFMNRRRCRNFVIASFICWLFLIVYFTNLGEANIGFGQVLSIILGKLSGNQEWLASSSLGIQAIVWDIRLPRILTGAFVGMGLAVSGVVFQSLLMNPLADPYTIGISTGAALGASIAIYLTGILQIATIPILPAAFVGAISTLILVTSIANRSRGMNAANLIIAGIIVSSILSAGISFIKNAAGEEVGAIVFWLMGSLASRTWNHVLVIVPVVIICSLVIFRYADELNLLGTGEDTAKGLGVDVKHVRRILLVAASLLTAACVSVSGIIGFVGLVIPHLLRFGYTSDNRQLLPMSALLGANLLLFADNLARVVFASAIPVGVLTTLMGGPFFLYIFMRRSGRGGEAA